jgi:hypothetical protein
MDLSSRPNNVLISLLYTKKHRDVSCKILLDRCVSDETRVQILNSVLFFGSVYEFEPTYQFIQNCLDVYVLSCDVVFNHPCMIHNAKTTETGLGH